MYLNCQNFLNSYNILTILYIILLKVNLYKEFLYIESENIMIEEAVLDNGLKIIVNKTNSEFVTIAYAINKGAWDETENNLGIAHLVEHMVFKGTANRDKNAVWEDIQNYGGNLNAYTSDNHTVFVATILAEYFDVAFDVVSDIVWNNTIPEEEFELEKNVVMEELKMYYDDASERVQDLSTAVMFKDYPAFHNVGGTAQTVSKITRQQVLDFINYKYIPQNVTLFVTGDVDINIIKSQIEEYLEDYEFVNNDKEVRPIISELNIEDAEDTIDGTQSTLIATVPVKVTNPKEYIMADILSDILGGGFGSRLMVIRENFGYAYTVYCTLCATDFTQPAWLKVYAGLNKENIDKTKEVIKECFDTITEGIHETEFKRSVITYKTQLKKQYETTSNATSLMIENYMVGFPFLTMEEYIEVLESITLEDVMEYVNENLGEYKMAYYVVKQTK